MRKLLAVLILTGALCGSALASPRWTVRTHPAVLAGMDPAELVGGSVSPARLRDAVNSPDLPGKIQAFLDLCAARGISEILLDGFQPELGGIYFRSDVLEQLGWKPVRDVLQILASESQAKGIKVGLVITELGIHARGFYEDEFSMEAVQALPQDQLEPFIGELHARYSIATVMESEFPSDWLPLLQEASGRHGIRHVHQGNADEIVALTGIGQRTTPIAAYPAAGTLSTRDYFHFEPGHESGPANGSLPLLLGPDNKSIETSGWFSGELFMRNLIAFRSVQAAPDEIILLAGPEDLRALPTDFMSYAAQMRQAHDPNRPVLNLVVAGRPQERLDAGHTGWLQLASNLDAIVLGGQAAGMQLRITETPLPNASAYYVYLAGPTPAEWIALERFLTEQTGKTVVVQLGSAIEGELLRRVAHFLGLDEAKWREGVPPSSGIYRTEKIRFAGVDLYQQNVPTGYLQAQASDSRMLMTTAVRLPLIVRHPEASRRFFINGNLIHRETAYPISQMLTDGKGLQAPASCLIAVGTRTVFWALEDTEVDWIHPQTGALVSLEMKKGGFYVTD